MKDKIPQWYKEIDASHQGMVLSGDIDSLFAATMMNKYNKGLDIIGFYDFNVLAVRDGHTKKAIGIDIDLKRGKAIGNHYTYIKNMNAINLNNINPDKRYFKKYPFSTLMLVMWLYNQDLSQFNDEQLKCILCIDSSFKGFYGDFSNINIDWAKSMDIYDSIKDVIDWTFPDEWDEIRDKYNLNGKIWLNDEGKLETDINLESLSELFGFKIRLPRYTFVEKTRFKNIGLNVNRHKRELEMYKDNIFSNAMIFKDYVKVSLIQ